MEKELEILPYQQLSEIYLKVKEFNSFLSKEYKEIEKLREEK